MLSPSCLFAQAAPDPAATAKIHLGPLAFTPTLQLTNVGLDTNVFNETEDRNPKSDWTLTVGPQADFWMRMGRLRLSGRAGAAYDWFATYGSQRAVGTNDRFRLELPLVRVRPYIGGAYQSVRDRPGYEIDVRVRHTERAVNGGVEFPVSKRSTFAVGWQRTTTDFKAGQAFEGTWLSDVLNRRLTAVTASARFKLTPLTTFVVEGESARERFEFTPGRDANSFRIVPGLEFDTFALIHGKAKVGYRRLKMLTPGMPDFKGAVAAVDLGYTLRGVTRFSVAVSRDINYSYQIDQPYYVLTGTTISMTQSVGGPWALTARAGLQHLAYRAAGLGLAGAELDAALEALGLSPGAAVDGNRVDRVRIYGGGLTYKLGPEVRLAFNVDYYKRRSEGYRYDYSGLRAGSSVIYGF